MDLVAVKKGLAVFEASSSMVKLKHFFDGQPHRLGFGEGADLVFEFSQWVDLESKQPPGLSRLHRP